MGKFWLIIYLVNYKLPFFQSIWTVISALTKNWKKFSQHTLDINTQSSKCTCLNLQYVLKLVKKIWSTHKLLSVNMQFGQPVFHHKFMAQTSRKRKYGLQIISATIWMWCWYAQRSTLRLQLSADKSEERIF